MRCEGQGKNGKEEKEGEDGVHAPMEEDGDGEDAGQGDEDDGGDADADGRAKRKRDDSIVGDGEEQGGEEEEVKAYQNLKDLLPQRKVTWRTTK